MVAGNLGMIVHGIGNVEDHLRIGILRIYKRNIGIEEVLKTEEGTIDGEAWNPEIPMEI